MKDGRGFWVGDYWGVDLVRRQRRRRQQRSEELEGPAQAGVQEQGRAQRQPALVRVGRRRRLLRRDRERRRAEQHRARDRLLRAAEERRQLPPGAGDAADDRVGPDPDHDRLGLPQPRLREELPGGEDHDGDPVGRGLRRALLPGRQRNRPASVGGAALAGVPLLRPGPAALAEGVLASGALHRHGRAQGRAEGAHQCASERGGVREGEVRERRRR